MGQVITVEAANLTEAIEAAAKKLGVETAEVEHDFDRDHMRSGSDSVRIFAAKKDPKAHEAAEALASSVRGIVERLGFEAEVEVKISLASVHIQLVTSPASSKSPRGDDELGKIKEAALADNAAVIGERALRVTSREMSTEGGRERRDRDDRGDRGGRDRDRRGGGRDRDRGGRDRDRGDRGRRPPARGERFERGDRPRGDDDRRPRRDPERDEEIRNAARGLIDKVLAGEGPQRTDDLNSYERFLVHEVATGTSGVASKSIGEGSRKAVEFFLGESTPPPPKKSEAENESEA